VQTTLLSLLALVALLNVPQAALETNALSESGKMERLITQLRDMGEVLLLAPAVVVAAALLVLAWRRRRELTCKAAAARSEATNEEAPLGEPLLS
jgi:hypothetical protein